MRIVWAESIERLDPDRLGQSVVVLDLSFAQPVAPCRMALTGRRSRLWRLRAASAAMTPLAQGLGERLVLWVDHHRHALWPRFLQDRRFVLRGGPETPACALLIDRDLLSGLETRPVDTLVCHTDLDGVISAARFLLHGRPPYEEALSDAVAADLRCQPLSPTGQKLDRALKAHPDEATRNAVLNWLVTRGSDAAQVDRAAEAYAPLDRESELLAGQQREVGICRIVDARDVPDRFDLTALLLRLQVPGRIGVVIHRSPGGDRLSVATRGPELDLPRTLGLAGGSPGRVCLDAGHLADLVRCLDRATAAGRHGPPPGLTATIEITRRCNLRCPLCPVGNGKARPFPDMTWELFRRTIDLFGRHLSAITLHNYGEPLLHPHLARFVRYAREQGRARVSLTTNGHVLSPDQARDLVQAGLDAIRFSVDTSDPEAYRSYRVGGDLRRVLDAMRLLRDVRASLHSERPRIEAQALVMRGNERFLEQFTDVVSAAGADEVRCKTVNVFMSGEEEADRGAHLLPASAELRRFADPNPRPADQRRHMRLCHWPWRRLVVLGDGTLVPCCHDFNAEFPLGNVMDGGLEDVWDSDLRRAFALRRIADPTSIPMCRRCSSAVPALGLRQEIPLPGNSDRFGAK